MSVEPQELERAVVHLVGLVDAPSVTGDEAPAVDEAERLVRDDLGLQVVRMEAEPGRDNLLVGDPSPRVLLCTHLDTVPPHIAASRDETHVRGRGACDAKGIAIAMVYALARLEARGEAKGLACLLVVGEESTHCGAMAAAASGLAPEHIVLGEPCGLDPAAAQKGLLKLRLLASGTGGHSAYPELGVSAIGRLLEAISRLEADALPGDPSLGPTTMNVGKIEGGVAANVIAPAAEALLLFRCGAPVDTVLAEVRARVGDLVQLEELNRAEPILFDVLGRSAGPAVPFNTDAHTLRSLGASMSLMGPGDMRCAHSAREELAIEDLGDGILAYEQVARGLLAGA
jgi:acetylornithine deacetylase